MLFVIQGSLGVCTGFLTVCIGCNLCRLPETYVHVGFGRWGGGFRGPRSSLDGQWRVSPSVIMSSCSSRPRTTWSGRSVR